MRLVCGIEELIVGKDCADRVVKNQYFKAEFEQHGNSIYAHADVPSLLNPAITFSVDTVDNWIGLTILQKIDKNRRLTSRSSGYFEKQDDKFIVTFQDSSSSQNSCEFSSYAMVCIYTSEDLGEIKP